MSGPEEIRRTSGQGVAGRVLVPSGSAGVGKPF